MDEVELEVAAEHIPTFLDEAQRRLESNRMKTAYGSDKSTHWIHTAITDGNKTWPAICVIEVRARKTNKGVTRVRAVLTEVRPPDGDEIAEGGYAELSPWPDDLVSGAREMILQTLHEAVSTATEAPAVVQCATGYLAFEGFRLSGEYYAGGWRLSAPQYPVDPETPASLYGEQMVVCEKEMRGRDNFGINRAFMIEKERLALLLTVFWCLRVRPTHYAEHRWVIEEIADGEAVSRHRQLGFVEPGRVRSSTMPQPGSLPPGSVREVDRLNPSDFGMEGDCFRPPSDATDLLELFYEVSRTNPLVSERFLAAAKAFQTSFEIWRSTPTGSMAYLVVAAESLVEATLETCAECKSKKGVSRAMRELIFEELPCLRGREQQVKRLLAQAYEIRSKHFHAGRFAAGELEPWSPVAILQPSRWAHHASHSRMLTLVNTLLVAWLVKRATGTVWPRATEPMPEWREPQMKSVSIRMR